MATPEFLAQWRSGRGNLSLLCRIDLPRADGTQTDVVYAALGDSPTHVETSSGDPSRLWSGLILEMDPIHVQSGFGSTDLALATTRLVLYADRAVTFPAGVGPAITQTLRQSMGTHIWLNATVKIWRYFHGLMDFDHAQTILHEGIVIVPALSGDRLELSIRQAARWNVPLAPRVITRKEFPRAPDGAIGLPLPACYGRHRWRPMRRPWLPAASSDYPDRARWFYTMAAGTAATGTYSKAVLVDTGRGGAVSVVNRQTRVAVAGHALGNVSDEQSGCSGWIETSAGLAMLDPEGTGYATGGPVEALNLSNLAGYKLPEEKRYALISLIPSDIVITSNMPDNPRQLLDPSDSNFVLFDYAANKRTLHYIFPPLPVFLQTGATATMALGYQTSADMNDFNGYISVNGGADAPLFGSDIPVATTPSILVGSAVTPVFNANYLYKFDFHSPAPAGKVRIFFVGLIVDFRPSEEVVQSERVVGAVDGTLPERAGGRTRQTAYKVFGPVSRTPAITELVGSFFSNFDGVLDDGLGSYTGTAGAIVQRTPDLIQHLLNAYGGMPLASIERTAGAFGSFVDARASLHIDGGDMVHAFNVSESTDVLNVIQWLTSESATHLSISPYDGMARLRVWRDNPAVDYPRLLVREDVEQAGGPSIEYTPVSDIITDVRVAYQQDARSGTYRSEVTISPDHSVGGHDWRGLRDQNMDVVDGVNDIFEFLVQTATGGAFVDNTRTLVAGAYVPQSAIAPGTGADRANGFAQQLKWATRGTGDVATFQVTYGTAITTGYNDRLDFKRNGVLFTVTLAPNDGSQSCEDLASQVTLAFNTAIGNPPPAPPGLWFRAYDMRYDRVTHGFKHQSLDGATWVIRGTVGTSFSDPWIQLSGWATLGFNQGGGDKAIFSGSGAYTVADDVRLERHFGLMGLGIGTAGFRWRFNLPFQSGVYGADSTVAVRNCGDLLGFATAEDKLADLSPSGGISWCADAGKGTGERLLATTAALFGRRRELSIRARTIQDDHTARVLRNRVATLFSGPRTFIEFSTRAMPDVELGHIFGFAEEMLRPYPGSGHDGLWVGKRFVVVEYAHHNGPTKLSTDIIGVDVTLEPLANIAGIAPLAGVEPEPPPTAESVLMGNIVMEVV